jgi:hypothetical protein
MPTYEDLVELAKICARGAWAATDESVATVLLEMAKEYQAEAAKFDSSKHARAQHLIQSRAQSVAAYFRITF